MGQTTRGPVAILVSLAVGLSQSHPQPAAASPPDRHASGFMAVSAPIEQDQTYRIECSTGASSGSTATFVAHSITSQTGKVTSWGMTAGYGGSDSYVGYRVGPAGATMSFRDGNQSTGPECCSRVVGESSSDGRLRVVWAGWGRPVACDVRIGGQLHAPREEASSRAEYFLASDLSDGVGAVVGPAPAKSASGGAVLSATRQVPHFLFGLLASDAGILRASSPDGNTTQSAGLEPRLAITSPLEGEWIFHADMLAADSDFPALFLLRL